MKAFSMMITLSIFTVSAFAGQDEYDDCVLKYLKGTKLDVVTHLIMQACKENYKSQAFTGERKKKYNECLLENLTGVESVPAVMEIKTVCDRKAKRGEK